MQFRRKRYLISKLKRFLKSKLSSHLLEVLRRNVDMNEWLRGPHLFSIFSSGFFRLFPLNWKSVSVVCKSVEPWAEYFFHFSPQIFFVSERRESKCHYEIRHGSCISTNVPQLLAPAAALIPNNRLRLLYAFYVWLDAGAVSCCCWLVGLGGFFLTLMLYVWLKLTKV